ncbi:MAG: ABC transporter substrate-binding protein [Lachnospiraceae bacterium]
MKKHKFTRALALTLASVMTLSLAACGGSKSEQGGSPENANVPTIDQLKVGEDYQDLTASIKVLTNRTDIVNTVYKGYAEEFMKIYPNITVEYEGITDYEESLNLRLTTGDWGDLCFIPTSVKKNELSTYFTPLGSFDTLDPIYNYCAEKTFDGTVYGIANGGTAGGVVYNKRIWAEAGITEIPTTPDEFLEDLKLIKEKTDAVPLYTNFAAGWTMGQWDSYIDIAATGDPDFRNNMPHMKDPFAKRDDMTGPYAVYYVMYEAVARKLVEEDPASSDWESSKSGINKGDIATMVLGSWAVQQCKDMGDTPDDVGYMPFPITVDGKRYAGAGGNYGFGINNQASEDNQIAAMLYLKWLLEESTIYEDEGSIPALKGEDLPDALADFEGVELLVNNPAPEGEEDLFDEVNNESEVGINSNDYPKCEIVEAALYGTRTLDDLMSEWNAKWTSAQENLGVEVTK